ncbi:helix-turn-helix domain-containing protein [Cobetia crustatorum]|uniref:helix-turn-helix domain-containing protein n=1 Tax=Cobetia crustatorum TaxID=553385 RepID=UPI00046B06B1|nr:helix-turn-helix domain-containing protein [Cobetia crustatorum]
MVELHHSEDITEHALQLNGWQQEFNQIEEGRFCGDILDIACPGVRLFRESANLGFTQLVRSPPSQWHLALPIHWPNGFFFHTNAITVFPHCEQFWSVTPASYDLMVVSVERDRYGWLEQNEQHLRTLEVSSPLLVAVKQQWQALTDYVKTTQSHRATLSVLQQSLLQKVITQQLQEGVELLLGECSRSPVLDDASYRTRRYIVDRCHALINARPDDPPSLMALCQQLKISRRTLQYSFQRETGQAPLHYLRALRLNAVRRRLLQNPRLQVADAAALHGFFHQSYFSREYRRLFKELPSVTRQRAL